MPLVVEEIPRFPLNEAVALARDLYGIDASAQPLPSDRDQNFLLTDEAGGRFVLKIANSSAQRGLLEAQNEAMGRVRRNNATLRCPRMRPTLSGAEIATVAGASEQNHFVRLLTYLPGVLLGKVEQHTPELLRSLGAFFGQLDRALEGFAHPGAQRHLEWDLKHGPTTVRAYIGHIDDQASRALVERHLARYESEVVPILPQLRHSVIHNDGNDNNILVEGAGSADEAVTGIIDFGDIVETCTVFEVAVTAAYALLDKPDPIAAAAAVAGGYDSYNALNEIEQVVLLDSIVMRLCMSVCLSAYQSEQNPENEYLVISQRPAWNALQELAAVHPDAALSRFQAACSEQG